MSPTGLAARLSFVAVLLFLLISSPYWTVRGDYEVFVSDGYVELRLSTVLTQNLTSTTVFSVDVNAQDRPNITGVIEQALKKEGSSPVLQDWRLHVESNGTRISMDGSMKLGGTISVGEDGTRVDLSWINFEVTEDFLSGGHSLNLVGRSYLLDRAVELASRQRFPLIQVLYTLNGVTRSHVDLRNDIDGLGLLDFSFVPVPLEKWTFRYDFEDGSVWTNKMSLRFVITTTVSEPGTVEEEPAVVRHAALYEFQTRAVYPGLASAEGSQILARRFVEELVMGIVIVGVLGILGATYILEHRISRTVFSRRRSGKK